MGRSGTARNKKMREDRQELVQNILADKNGGLDFGDDFGITRKEAIEKLKLSGQGLASESRRNLTENMEQGQVNVYSDFSKEYEHERAESTKSEKFGLSNITMMLLPVVIEYPTQVPTPPQELRWDGQSLYFVPPKWDGGGRILEYKVQLKPVDGQHFLVFKVVPVLYLSEWPNLEDNFFGDLGGKFILRVVARNRVGCSNSDTILVDLKGTQGLSSTLEVVEDEEPTSYSTSWEEHLFIGEHKGVPKDTCTVEYAVHEALEDIREHYPITSIRRVTDRGGENWGSQALSKYSLHGEADVVWAPTCENHSGQPSDSSGGTCKRSMMDLTKAGQLEGVNSAEELVAKLQQLS